MAKKRTRIINLFIKPGTFSYIFKRLTGNKEEYDFSELADLRRILSDEKAKILNIIKSQNPSSIYDLAKMLKRDFRSVFQDVKILERFGLIELKPHTKGKRKSLKPEPSIDTLQVNIHFE